MGKYKHPGNPELYAAMIAKRSSNACVPFEDKRTKRERSRNAANKAAIRRSQE